MGKTLGKIALIAAVIAVNFIPGVGQAISGALIAGSFAAAAIVPTILVIADLALISAATAAAGSFLKPKVPPATLSRLNLSFDPNTSRKMWLGATAGATDVIYQEPSGANQEYIDYIVVVAAHAADAITEIRTEDKLLWTVGGGVQGMYVGYCTVDVILDGTSANAISINGGATWNASSCRMTGCCYFHMRIKRTGNSKKAESPFSSGLNTRLTVIGRGMKLYDPRRDSTRGGSGSMRADDQTTWAFAPGGTEIGQNHALQLLSAGLIGWKIGGVVSVGGGMPVDRIDFADFITAANICDEAVTKAAGGTQRRYEGAGLFGDDEDPGSVLTTLCAHMDAELRDVNGRIGIRIGVNDLSGGLPAFTADDVLGGFEWHGFSTLSETQNVVRGRYTDPSAASLYQLTPYTTVSTASPDGINRPETLDLALCQDPERASRLAQRLLLRLQVQGIFSADFGPRAWALRPGQPLTLTFQPAGLAGQKMRVISQALKTVVDDDGARQFCAMTLRVEDPALYVWTPGAVALPASAIPAVSYNPLNNPLAITQGADIGVQNGADVTASNAPALTGDATFDLQADYLGAYTTTLPLDRRFKAVQGTTDVSTTSGFVLSGATAGVAGVTVDNTPASATRGVVTIPAGVGAGTVVLTATTPNGGVAAVTLKVTKTNAQQPSGGGGGGGGGGSTSVTGSAPAASSSASYGTSASATLTLPVASGQTITFSAPLGYTVGGPTTAAVGCYGKWQYRLTGSSTWIDVAAEIGESVTAYTHNDPPVVRDPGSISVNQTKSGLAAGTYELQLIMRDAAGTRVLTFTGSISATAA